MFDDIFVGFSSYAHRFKNLLQPNHLEVPKKIDVNAGTKFKCDQCNTFYSQKKDLKLHVKGVHLGEKNLKCDRDQCPFLTNWPSDLKRHIAQVHGGEDKKFYVCEYQDCPAVYTRNDKLKKHIASIHENLRFNCDHCDKSFFRKESLNAHVKTKH